MQNFITKWTGHCKECTALTGMFMYSGTKPVSKKQSDHFAAMLTLHRHKDCGGEIVVSVEHIDSESETVRELTPRQKRSAGGGRKKATLPCPSCGTELGARERQKPCPKCGARYVQALQEQVAKTLKRRKSA